MKQNCWEYKMCGREPGGERFKECGVCPASVEVRLNGIHGGLNGGRSCWVVAGTLCDENEEVTADHESEICTTCDFYQHVKTEEKNAFIFSGTLLTDLINGRQGDTPPDYPSR